MLITKRGRTGPGPFILAIAIGGGFVSPGTAFAGAGEQPSITSRAAPVLDIDGLKFRDLDRPARVYARAVDADAIRTAGLVPVEDPAEAEVALVRISTPFEQLHPYHFIGSHQHEGRLDFRAGNPDLEAVQQLSGCTPVIAALFLDRPAVLGPMNEAADAILANFGVSDAALLAAVTGLMTPRGRLPFELPSSMAAADAQAGDVPDDSIDPLYPVGAGIVPPQ